MDSVFSVLFPTTLRSVRLSLCPGFCPCRMVSHHTQFCLSFCKSFIMSILYGFQPHTFIVVFHRCLNSVCSVWFPPHSVLHILESVCSVRVPTTFSYVCLCVFPGFCLFCIISHPLSSIFCSVCPGLWPFCMVTNHTQFLLSFFMSWNLSILCGPHQT